MIPISTIIAFDLSEAIRKFCQLTGWESTENGEWGCKFDKPVTFSIDYEENYIFQHEQDYVYIYCEQEDNKITTEDIIALYSNMVYDRSKYWGHGVGVYEYKGHKILRITMSDIVNYLITQNELPKNMTLMLTNLSLKE